MEKQYAPSASEKKQMNTAKAPVQTSAQKQPQKIVEKTNEPLAEVKQEEKKHLIPMHSETKKDEVEGTSHEGHDHSHEGHNHDHSHEHKEVKTEDNKKKETKAKPIVKKDEAVAYGNAIRSSKKVSMYICDFIKNKPIDLAITQLQEVIKMKRAIPFKGEIPHRHGKGMMSGRYPIDVSKIFISMLKGLKGNVIANGMDLDKARIVYGSASWAARPQRAGGVRAKRTNVILKAREVILQGEKK